MLTPRSSHTVVRASVAAIASSILIFALAGCSPGPLTPGGPVSASPLTAEPETPAPGAALTEEQPSAEQPAADVPAGTCLVGSWVMPGDQMQSFYDQAIGDTPADLTVSGQVLVDFTGEGTYEYTPDFTLLLEIMSVEATGNLTGSIRGEYTSDDGIIITSNNATDVEVKLLIDGQPMDGTEQFEQMMAISPINDAPYECSGDTATIKFATGEGNPRTPVQLTRVG